MKVIIPFSNILVIAWSEQLEDVPENLEKDQDFRIAHLVLDSEMMGLLLLTRFLVG